VHGLGCLLWEDAVGCVQVAFWDGWMDGFADGRFDRCVTDRHVGRVTPKIGGVNRPAPISHVSG
jgi:hypothetical protein